MGSSVSSNRPYLAICLFIICVPIRMHKRIWCRVTTDLSKWINENKSSHKRRSACLSCRESVLLEIVTYLSLDTPARILCSKYSCKYHRFESNIVVAMLDFTIPVTYFGVSNQKYQGGYPEMRTKFDALRLAIVISHHVIYPPFPT